MVWYFSFDQGRDSNARRVTRLEMENLSLRERLALAEADLQAVKDQLVEARLVAAQALEGTGNSLTSNQANIAVGSNLDNNANIDASKDEANTTNNNTTTATDANSSAASTSAVRPADDLSNGRMTLKLDSNRAAFGGKAIISLVEVDSLDQAVVIRVRESDTGKRIATSLSLGDFFEFELGAEKHSLYLDSIKGTLAFFILDGLPRETTTDLQR
jgi:hypothetical protein